MLSTPHYSNLVSGNTKTLYNRESRAAGKGCNRYKHTVLAMHSQRFAYMSIQNAVQADVQASRHAALLTQLIYQ